MGIGKVWSSQGRDRHFQHSPTMKQLLFLAEPHNPVNGQVVLGLASCLNKKTGWRVRMIRPEGNPKRVPAMLRRIAPDAIVVHYVFEPKGLQQLMATGLPLIVACVDHYPHLPLPLVSTDHYMLGQMAAEHFLERQFHNFARIGYGSEDAIHQPSHAGKHVSATRVAGYRARLRRSGFAYQEILIPLVTDEAAFFGQGSLPRRLLAALNALPKPCGILTEDDTLGAGVIEYCLFNNIKVPEEIAVLGAGNAVVPCTLSQPNLSSIAESFDGIGRECARMILNWDKASPPGRTICTVPPLGVITRESTDIQEINNPIVNQALKYISDNIGRAFNISHLINVTGVSRPTLVSHFKDSLRRTPIMEIRRQRVERAKYLLAETNETGKSIAKQCGMKEPVHFCRVFKELTGITPQEYRRRAQNLKM